MITEILRARQADGVVTARLRAAAPWGITRGPSRSVVFHLVLQGNCWLRTPGAEPLRLETGDVAMLPDGAGHVLSSDRPSHQRRRVVLDEEVLGNRAEGAGSEINIAGIGPHTRLLCAGYRPEAALPALLPPVLHVPTRQSAARRDLAETLRMLDGELTGGLPGAQLIVDRLVDIAAMHALRSWLPSDDPVTWPTPHHDVAVAVAVTALHRELDRPWTLDELAGRSGLSRATLTRRFTSTMGEPPFGYLRRQRMELAARRLRESDDSLTAIAKRVGYTSEFAFSRAFSRTFGIPPSHYRTASRQASLNWGRAIPSGAQ
ncbi:AraC family transcriptional regulator [Saccharopolyspora shandongensis]|uniref:AraC family transcriptional regulator n=1 Tax=Saccharopolyspora shandongensis TaxID=418495 RepID=UPI00342166A9